MTEESPSPNEEAPSTRSSGRDAAARAAARMAQSRQVEGKKSGPDPIAWLLAGVGWALTLVLLVAWMSIHNQNEARLQEARAKTTAELNEWKEKTATVKERVEKGRQEITRELNTAVAAERELRGEIAVLEKDIAELEAKRMKIAKQMAKIGENFTPVGDDAIDTGVEAKKMAEKLRDATRLRNKLWRAYSKRYHALNKMFYEARKEKKPAKMSAFFEKAKHTPFGPAAAWFAAEKYYQAGWHTRAKSLYKYIRDNFSDSPYSNYVAERLQQVAAEAKYKRGTRAVHIYKRYQLPKDKEEEEGKKK